MLLCENVSSIQWAKLPSLSVVKLMGSMPRIPLTVVPLYIGNPRIGVKDVRAFCLKSKPRVLPLRKGS